MYKGAELSTSEFIAEALSVVGLPKVFGLMAEDVAPLVVALADRGVEYFGTRHESVAVSMADGYAWRSGELGVCVVGRGSGFLNSLNALKTAVNDQRRLLLITAEPAAASPGSKDHKNLDQGVVASAIGVRYFSPRFARDVDSTLCAAIEAAQSGYPSVLSVPMEVLWGPACSSVETLSASLRQDGRSEPAHVRLTDDAVRSAVNLLVDAEIPLVLAGRGAGDKDIIAMIGDLALQAHALVGTTLLVKGAFNGHPNDVGVVGGFASEDMEELLGRVDMVLAVGASLNSHTTAQQTLFAKAKLVRIDNDPHQLHRGMKPDVALLASASEGVRMILESLPEVVARQLPPRTAPGLRFEGPDQGGEGTVDPRILASTLDALLPIERTVVLDSGRFMTSPGRYMRVSHLEGIRVTNQGGSISVGFGVAMGTALARPTDPVVLFIGDGGLSMVLGDLATAAKYRIPLVIVVMNDASFGAEAVILEELGLDRRHADLLKIDFASVARSIGVEGHAISELGHLHGLAERLQRPDGPLLLDCKIPSDFTARRITWK